MKVHYTDHLIARGYDGLALWPLGIFIRPRCRADAGLHAHEAVHYEEQRAAPVTWWLRYALSRRFRVQAEARAYRVSMQHGMSLERAVALLRTYDARLTDAEAKQLLVQQRS